MIKVDREPDFSRMRCALLREGEPDFLPIANIDICQRVKDEFMGKPVNDIKTDVDFWVKSGYDYLLWEVGMWMFPVFSDVRQEVTYEYGEGQENSRTWYPESGEGKLRSVADLEALPWPSAKDLDWSYFKEAPQYMPEKMKGILYTGGIFTAAWGLLGMENYCMDLVLNPELIKAVMEKCWQLQLDVIDEALTYGGIGAMWFADDLAYRTQLLIAPEYYRKYFIPSLAKAVEKCHAKGIPVIYHSDGLLDDLVPDFIEIGIDALHPIDPTAMDIIEFKKQYGDRLCVMGNIDLVYTLPRGTTEEVEAEVKQKIKDLAPGGGYILTSANTVPEYVPVQNYEAMVAAAHRYGKYPIKK